MAETSVAPKHRLLVVGGRDNNVPAWAEAAFEVELITGEQESGRGKLEPKQAAEAVVIHLDYVSHNYADQAREWAGKWNVPWFGVRKGWSSAVDRAARMGLAWFVDAVQLGGEAVAGKNEPRAEEAKQLVENAWKDAATYAQARAAAAEKRLGQETKRREQIEGVLDRVRGGAEQRIVSEIRRRAAEVRASEHQRLGPIRKASADLIRSVRKSQEVIVTAQNAIASALRDVDRARGELNRLLDDERVE